VRDTLKTIPGVGDVDVDFQRARATLTLDLNKNTPESVARQLSEKTHGRYSASVIAAKP
jgi:hypothetical protein